MSLGLVSATLKAMEAELSYYSSTCQLQGIYSEMAISSPKYLSIWDVAHHWHDMAVPIEPGPLPPGVRNMVTSLLQAVLNSDLGVYEPIVIPDPIRGDPGRTKVHMRYLESLPPEFEDMFLSGLYDAKVLATYRVDIDDILWWAASNGEEDIPSFCISERYRSKPKPPSKNTKVRPEAEVKRECQEMAKRMWAEDDQIRIAEMARTPEIQIEASGRLYQRTTLIRWLGEVAPEVVRNRRGRPVKKAEE